MAKPDKRLKSRKLRKRGESIRDIAKTIGVSRGSVSRWCSDIELTKKQLKRLQAKQKRAGTKALLKASEQKKKERKRKIENYKKKGIERLKNLSDDEFLAAGLAMYLGEGYKKGRKINFANSDPEIIKFMINWFKKFFNINDSRFTFRVMINKIHKNREGQVKKFWENEIGIKEKQWRKIQFLGPKPKKKFENHNNHYGTLSFKVLKSTNLFYEIQGLMHGLLKSANKKDVRS